MLDLRLYLIQRISALVLAPLVLVHILLMIYAVQDGLTAEEILGRTRGSAGWAIFYGVFVLAAAAHAAVGVRAMAAEWAGLKAGALTILGWAVFLILGLLGARAVFAVIGG